jgi:hypothetical protein
LPGKLWIKSNLIKECFPKVSTTSSTPLKFPLQNTAPSPSPPLWQGRKYRPQTIFLVKNIYINCLEGDFLGIRLGALGTLRWSTRSTTIFTLFSVCFRVTALLYQLSS